MIHTYIELFSSLHIILNPSESAQGPLTISIQPSNKLPAHLLLMRFNMLPWSLSYLQFPTSHSHPTYKPPAPRNGEKKIEHLISSIPHATPEK